jgi:IgA Peptidase M64
VRFWFILPMLLPSMLAAQPYPLETLRYSGPVEKRINLLILGDGYRACDQRQFSKEAKSVADALFAATPFQEYSAFFNVWAAHVVSKQRGADNGNYGTSRETALGANLGCGRARTRSVCLNEGATLSVARQVLANYDYVIVLINETVRAGSASGEIARLTNAKGFENTFIHELGHSIGLLADEYETAYPGFPACQGVCREANASTVGTADVKWATWVDPSTPLPTPENTSEFVDKIGAFEGGRYLTTGIFRPKQADCRMRASAKPFCSVCSEQLVKSIRNRLPFFEVFGPPPQTEVKACEQVKFFVRPPAGLEANMTYSWRVNDAGVDAGGPTFETFVSDSLHVSVTGRDVSSLVRNDPTDIMSETVAWQIGIDAGACDRIGQCTSGVATGPTCDDAGVCQLPTRQSCWPYTCESSGIKCAMQCDGGAECGAGARCENSVCIGDIDAGIADGGIDDAGINDAGIDDAGINDAGINDAGINDESQHTDSGVDSILSMYPETCPAEERPPVKEPDIAPKNSCGCDATSSSLLGALLVFAWRRRRA